MNLLESSYNLNENFDIKKLIENEDYRKESCINVSEQGSYYVLKYDRSNNNRKLTREELENKLGVFRSVILDKNYNVVCFAPPKSKTNMDTNYLFDNYDSKKFWIEEIVEGTMINLFWIESSNEWELTTRSQIGAKSKYNYESKNTFRYMCLETMNEMEINLNDFDKNFCYSFILQHPDNKRVCKVEEKKLWLTNVYALSNITMNTNNNGKVTPVPRNMLHNKLNLIIKSPSYENILLPKVCYPENNEITKEDFNNLLSAYHDFNFPGYMINVDLDRIKFTNPEYNKIKYLKGNSPRLQYTYYELRKKGKVTEYLKYFPENANIFNTFRNDLHNYTKKLHNCYVSCYIKKEKPIKSFPYQYKTHMYYLHQLYLENYKDNNEFINKSKVIDYVNNLETPRLLHVVNYNWDKKNNTGN